MTGREEEDDDLPIRLGETVAAKYRVERVVGSGGMGLVVEATHLQLLQRVAIKLLRADALDESAAIRLLREARAAVVLQSEHVARVTDVGTLDSGTAYLVMEYLDGETLAERIKRASRLSVGEAVWVLSQACKGLAEAHRRGIVHRDVKPANIMLARKGDGALVTKILDFGIAKVADPRVAVASELTSSQHALGTPRYMSPEQLTASSQVDARTDVWALGIVLYECIVGATPFPRGTSYEVGARILAGAAPRMSETVHDVPAELDALVARCLSREASARFTDASELLLALEGTGIAARPVLDDAASPPPLHAKETPTSLGIGAPHETSMPATRVAPLVVPQAFVAAPAPSAPAGAELQAIPSRPVDKRSLSLVFVLLSGLAGAVVVSSIVAVLRGTPRAPTPLVPVPMSTEASAVPTARVPPPPPLVGAAPPASVAEASPTTSAASSEEPSLSPRATTRKPTARPMTRPPNER